MVRDQSELKTTACQVPTPWIGALLGIVMSVAPGVPSIGQTTRQLDLTEAHGIMQPGGATLRGWMEERETQPLAIPDPAISKRLEATQGSSFSILDHMTYVPSQRNQGHCGNCWVWAATGVVEIAGSTQADLWGVNDRLSIQLMNSCGTAIPNGYACCGGTMAQFAEWYQEWGYFIPWANSEGAFQDGARQCSSGSSQVACSSISKSPRYQIGSIQAQSVPTTSVPADQAIQGIKNLLHQHRGVVFQWALATDTQWHSFFSFWNNRPESEIWDPDPFCGYTYVDPPSSNAGGGHLALLVGYDDTDSNPANHYWLLLNSWGATKGRPNGLFRVKMHMNYDCWLYTGSGGFFSRQFDTLLVQPASSVPTASLSVTRAPGMPGTPACGAPAGAVKGFPGDAFVLTDQSSNGTTLEQLEVTLPDQSVQDLTTALASGSMTWISPNTSGVVGPYTFALKVRDASQNLLTDTEKVYLCGNPVARLAMTHSKAPGGSWQMCNGCSWLQGYTLRFSTLTSDGHPLIGSTNPTWNVQLCPSGTGCSAAPAGDFLNKLDGTLELTLNGTGDYTLGASVAYPYLEPPVASGNTTIHSGAVMVAFAATQGSSTIVPGGWAVIGSPITLTFTGQVAPPNTATCTWVLTPNVWSAGPTACGSGASIPASTLTSGQRYTLQLTAVSSPATDQAVASLTFTATDMTGDFSHSPSAVNIGTLVSFTGDTPANTQKARWTFGETGCDSSDTSVKEGGCTLGCVATFHFKSAGTKSVTLAISMDGITFTLVATKQLTVNNTGTCSTACVVPSAPSNPSPANGAQVTSGDVTFTWTAASGSPPPTYDVFYDSAEKCSAVTATQCQVTNVQTGSHTWHVQAKNTCGTGTSPTWSFSVCPATEVPVAVFTWTPKDPVTIGGVVQNQPYVGQAVTFDPSATTSFPTSYHWYDFSESPSADYTVATPTHTWQAPGDKPVRMKATNCVGTSAEAMLVVKVYPDIRPVAAGFTSTVTDPLHPQVVTFTAAIGTANGDPNHFTWDFGDGETASGSDKGQVVHAFKCGAIFTVKLTSRRIKNGSDVSSQPSSQEVQVGGTSCSPQSLMVMDVARNLPGKNNTLWNTDLTLYNPTEQEMMLKMAVRRSDLSPREESRSFSLLSRETLSLEQVLSYVGLDFQKACLWFYQADPLNRGLKPLPVISARTHTGAVAPHDDYGQFVMVVPVYQAATTKQTLYLTGLRHNGKPAQDAGQGFRTNVTIVEPAGVGWGANAVKLTLLKAGDPSFVKERQLWASGKYGYWQKSVESFFSGLTADEDLGRIILKVEIEPGAAIALGSSLINNGSNAPVFVPTQTLSTSAALVVPDVARNLPGKNNSLWNTDLTLFNPMDEAMSLRLAAKKAGTSTREESRPFSILAGEILSMDQVLAYVGMDFQKAALWFYHSDPTDRGVKSLPLIAARTHTGAVAPYDSYGQFVQVEEVNGPSFSITTSWLVGARHNGKPAQTAGQGFRTNLTLINPLATGWPPGMVRLWLSKADDPSYSRELAIPYHPAFAYEQRSVEQYFGLSPDDDLGRIIVRVDTQPGSTVVAAAALVDNGTNAPIYIPAQTSQAVSGSATLTPAGRHHGTGAEFGAVEVSAPSGGVWQASSQVGWITISSGASGRGSGTAGYSVVANGTTSQRTGTLTIAGQTFTVTQDGL